MSQTTLTDESYFTAQRRHVQQCLKEARMVVVFWIVGMVYCVTMFLLLGYIPPEQRPDEPSLILGIPSWVFWGLFLPWFVQIGLSSWFAICVMKDDEPYQDFPDTNTNPSPEQVPTTREQ